MSYSWLIYYLLSPGPQEPLIAWIRGNFLSHGKNKNMCLAPPPPPTHSFFPAFFYPGLGRVLRRVTAARSGPLIPAEHILSDLVLISMLLITGSIGMDRIFFEIWI